VLAKVAQGLADLRRGDAESGLRKIQDALVAQPDDLLIGNTYRMSVMSLRRSTLANGAGRETLAEHLPPHLQGEPVKALERLYREHPGREAGFQLAMGWNDYALSTPKAEEKMEPVTRSIEVLNEVLAKNPYYMPALCVRGIGYLNAPSSVALNPSMKSLFQPVPDAASRDLALCVAIGRKLGGASAEAVGTLALALGDAYAKEGQPQRARSWWQMAQNASREPALLAAIERRYAWRDEDVPRRLQAELDAQAGDLDHPVTDLAMLWRP
jgi:hypothetical protein